MSTTTPIPDEQPQDGATPTLADYARALRRYTEAYIAERSARQAVRDYTADSSPAGGLTAAGKDLDRALEDAVTVRRRLEEDLQGIRKALEVASGKETEELVADFILKWHPKPSCVSSPLRASDAGSTVGASSSLMPYSSSAFLAAGGILKFVSHAAAARQSPSFARRWNSSTTSTWRPDFRGELDDLRNTILDEVRQLELDGSPWVRRDAVAEVVSYQINYLADRLSPPLEQAPTEPDPRVRTENDDTELRAVLDPTLVEVRDLLKELVASSRVERATGSLASALSTGIANLQPERPQQSSGIHSFEDFINFHAAITRGVRPAELPLLGEELGQIRDRVFGEIPEGAAYDVSLVGLDGFRARVVLAMLALHHLERVRENGRVFVLGPNAPAARSVVKVAAEIASAVPSLGGWAFQEYGIGRLKGLGRGSIVAVNAGVRRGGASSIEGEIPTLILAPWLRTEEHEAVLRTLQAKAARTSSRWVVPTVRVEAKED